MLITEELVGRCRFHSSILNDLIYLPRMDTCVLFISKNASTWLKTYFAGIESGRRLKMQNRDPHSPGISAFQTITSLGHQRMSEIMSSDNSLKIVVGRNPVHRAVSAFNSRVHTWQPDGKIRARSARFEWTLLRQQIVGNPNGQHASPIFDALGQTIQFDQFLDYIEIAPNGELDRHLVPQWYFAGMDLIEFDLIGKVEELPDFLDRVESLTGSKGFRKAPARNATSAYAVSAGALSREQISRLRNRYSEDFDYLDYP